MKYSDTIQVTRTAKYTLRSYIATKGIDVQFDVDGTGQRFAIGLPKALIYRNNLSDTATLCHFLKRYAHTLA